jgi:hypothetical protein
MSNMNALKASFRVQEMLRVADPSPAAEVIKPVDRITGLCRFFRPYSAFSGPRIGR